MKITKLLSFFAFALLGLSSCGPNLSYLTEDLYADNRWSDDELKKIQFYVSQDIVLRREASSGVSKIESGRIKVVDGKKVEEIVIRKGTPGVFLFRPQENRFAVSFESGGRDRYLMFGPNPQARGRYVLLASDWKRTQGLVSYDNAKYYTPTSSAYAALMVDMNKVRRIALRSRTAKGRSVD